MSQGLSLGRIQAGLAQATQEFTVAAANLNFDFTLVKIEAPAEYQNIGHILNPSRVREAETGTLHVTASRLGALFDGACPETPNLIKAYGMRASEISKEVSDSESEKSNGSSYNWIRNEYGGIDATSIWAAATSSKAALPVHLLACIIARMWTHTEATSVWVEIVAERKREVASKFEEDGIISTKLAYATRQDITRDHLSKWDASARAWLQTADKARERHYKQFLLIVKNLSIAVHQKDMALYTNVMDVWASALSATEGLISGKPHAVQNGPVLLGLSAWHIFPDMLVFGSPAGNVPVLMDDPLVKPSGVLTLGISDPARSEKQGVYWSLSLSHHKYYGEAVKRTRRLESDGSRLTFDELVLVCLGSLFKIWSIPKKGIDNSIKILQKLRKILPHENGSKSLDANWQTVLEQPMLQYADGDKQAELAMSLGRRRPQFLSQSVPSGGDRFFGLLHLPNLLYVLKHPDQKIELLRRVAGRVPGLDNSNSIIFCASYEADTESLNTQYATVFTCDSKETNHSSLKNPTNSYYRWINVPSTFQDEYKMVIETAIQDYSYAAKSYQHAWTAEDGESVDPFIDVMKRALLRPKIDKKEEKEEDNDDYDGALRGKSGRIDGGFASPLNIGQEGPETNAHPDPRPRAWQSFKVAHKKAMKDLEILCDTYMMNRERQLPSEALEYQHLWGDKPPQWTYERFWDAVRSKGDKERFGSFFGLRDGFDLLDFKASGEHAVVYAKGEVNTIDPVSKSGTAPNVTLDDILWCLEYDLIDVARLQNLLSKDQAFGFLEVLSVAGEIYREPASGGATISCSIIDKPFELPIFSKSLGQNDWKASPSRVIINETTAIGLIGYFETGHNVIDSMKGKYNIIGLSGGDSIFVWTSILNDPDTIYPNYSFTRILGNTGKAGFSILTSPAELMVRKLDPTAWRVESTSFDGSPLNSFDKTSLHLSFTDWQAPMVQFQSVGQQDADIYIVEAVVSVRDAGKWVADVDISRALLSPRFGRLQMTEGCNLHSEGMKKGMYPGKDQEEMISIETWDQVLDQVDGSAVVRCFDNWVARLAIVSVLCQQSQGNERPVVICPKKMCWKCHADHLTEGADFTYVF